MKKLILLNVILYFSLISCESVLQSTQEELKAIAKQNQDTLWTTPISDERFAIHGRAWARDEYSATPYSRLPEKARNKVEPIVWILANRPAGMSFEFLTDADAITIRYSVTGPLAMHNMPMMGVSGVDLYALNPDTEKIWVRPRYKVRDTITCNFTSLGNLPKLPGGYRKFQLYLPLYNSINKLEIGLVGGSLSTPTKLSEMSPIIVYGTSIVQGASASRPGLAWTSILQRETDWPVVNLGFSDNGKMAADVTELIADTEASLYVIDCLPNMINEVVYTDSVLKKRINETYEILRMKRNTPILFTEHTGLGDEYYNLAVRNLILRVNSILSTVVKEIVEKGDQRVFLLKKESMNLCSDCTVDGTHPTDRGMYLIANAYKNKIQSIFQEIPPK